MCVHILLHHFSLYITRPGHRSPFTYSTETCETIRSTNITPKRVSRRGPGASARSTAASVRHPLSTGRFVHVSWGLQLTGCIRQGLGWGSPYVGGPNDRPLEIPTPALSSCAFLLGSHTGELLCSALVEAPWAPCPGCAAGRPQAPVSTVVAPWQRERSR